jgi:hypothetical protein
MIGASGDPLSSAWLVMAAGAVRAAAIWSMCEVANKPLE